MVQHPIVVDLDGTLILTDMLHESALRMFRDRPLDALWIPFWLSTGKATLKREIASRTAFDPAALPYNEELIECLRARRAEGLPLVLCTASYQSVADTIAGHLLLFDDVIGSDGTRNLSGGPKADMLEAQGNGVRFNCQRLFLAETCACLKAPACRPPGSRLWRDPGYEKPARGSLRNTRFSPKSRSQASRCAKAAPYW